MTALVQRTIAYIKREHITPSPGWHFLVIRFLWWLGVIMALIVSSLLTAFSMHIIFEMEWHMLAGRELGAQTWFLLLAPIFWMSILAIFLSFASYCFSRTDYGYRYAMFKVIGFFFFVSFALAFALEFSPLDNPLERVFLQFASPAGLTKNLVQ